MLIKKDSKFGYYNQQDANECLLYLLEILEKEIENLHLPTNYPFLGYYMYMFKCLKCKKNEYFLQKNTLLMIDIVK